MGIYPDSPQAETAPTPTEEPSMKIMLIGASGYVGSALLNELLERGHQVTAAVRNPERLPAHPALTAVSVNVQDAASIASAAQGHAAVISAFSPGLADPDLYANHVAGVASIIDGVKRAKVARLLMVGGAGALEVAPGVQLVDTPEFPAQWKQTALATREGLHRLQNESSLRWSFLAPAAHLEPGERTGQFRLGNGEFLVDAQGNSHISVSDYAVAMVDELEQSRHERRLFNVAY
ncbi:NAD(P)-dependent oxidoreductase [Lysobacter tyrosinilyticus]